MPIIIPDTLPAFSILTRENIVVMNQKRAESQDIRPLNIAILNLMPTKIVTETQLMRLLSNSPIQVNITLLSTKSYVGTHTPLEHLEKFYKSFSDVRDKKFDGMIITGAPVEDMEFEDVAYWDELEGIFDYTKSNVTSTIFICWSAQAALYHFYKIKKHRLPHKLFGIFEHYKANKSEKLLKGIDDKFFIPHSRKTTILEKDVKANKDLELLVASTEAGCGIIKSRDDKSIFILGHVEYDRDTLEMEYKRDLEKGLDIDPPKNYYTDKGMKDINMCWSSTANLIYMNWLNHYVYQVTPYDI